MFCIYIHHGSECREDVNWDFFADVLLLDKHIGREGTRVRESEKKEKAMEVLGT